MRKTILAALTAFGFSAAAYAQSPESWTYAGMRGGAMGWETSAINRDTQAGTASTLRFLYFAGPAEGAFNWVIQHIRFDCAANTFRLMGGAYFAEEHPGYLPDSDADLPVRSGTPEYALKRVLCDSAILSGALQAASMADAMDGAEKAALP